MAVTNDDSTRPDGTGHGLVFAVASLIAVGHLAFVAVRPTPAAVEIAVVEGVVLLALLAFAAVTADRSPGRLLAGTALLFVGLVGGTWLVAQSRPLWQASLLFVAAGALLSYGLYRYQLVTLGLVEAR